MIIVLFESLNNLNRTQEKELEEIISKNLAVVLLSVSWSFFRMLHSVELACASVRGRSQSQWQLGCTEIFVVLKFVWRRHTLFFCWTTFFFIISCFSSFYLFLYVEPISMMKSRFYQACLSNTACNIYVYLILNT